MEASKAWIVVDAFSSGIVLAKLLQDRGHPVVRVISSDGVSEELLNMVPASCHGLKFAATIKHTGNVEDTVRRIRNLKLEIVHCTAGCESGVECSDQLAVTLGLPANYITFAEARRNKYLMQENIREAGLRAITQISTNTWDEAEAFITRLQQRIVKSKVVLKPLRSAGTEDVYCATTLSEAKEGFMRILGRTNIFGEVNDAVLVQEYLQGSEYVVDSVSRNGQHKIVAFYRYDKRHLNGSDFVYYGVEVFESQEKHRECKMAEYVSKVLDSLGIRHGAGHAEVMWLDAEQEPCLVEIGARSHGGEGTFVNLAQPTYGYNQLSVMIDAIQDQARWDGIPLQPNRLLRHARELTLVSTQHGILKSYPLLDKVKQLSSFDSMEIKVHPGEVLLPTTDFLTTPGSVMLVHADRTQVERDYDCIHAWIETGAFYVVSPHMQAAPQGS